MFNSFYKITFLGVLLVLPLGANAQSCGGPYEAVTRLERPREGSYPVWGAQFGVKDALERFDAGAMSAAGNTVLAGIRTQGGKDSLFIAELDVRGRAVWEVAPKITNIKKITKMFARKKSYVLLADQGDAVWIGMFNETGVIIRQKRIAVEGKTLKSHDLIESTDGKGFILAASEYTKGGKGPGSAVIYKLNEKGDAVISRSYMPGMESSIMSVAAASGGYIGGGAIRGDNGLMAGWALRLTEDLSLEWQQQYPRAGSVWIKQVAMWGEQQMIVAGDTGSAIWVMAMDPGQGAVRWQRYYTTKGQFILEGMISHDDGRVSMLAQAIVPEATEYAQIINVSPYGGLLQVEMFDQTEGVGVASLFKGVQGQRMIAGSANITIKTRDPAKPEAEPQVVHDTNGWIAAAMAFNSANEKCASLPSAPQASPDADE